MDNFDRAIVTMIIICGDGSEDEYTCIYVDRPVIFEVTIPKDQILRFSVKCLDKFGNRLYTARNILTVTLTTPVDLTDPIKIDKTHKCSRRCTIL